MPHRAVHVHPSGHAGYYPGAAMMHLKVVFDPETGRVLGGQAAGFVATNVVLGDLELWYAEDYSAEVDGARIIDVRTPDEFSIWHLPGAENVPLATLRSVCGEWNLATPIRLYCAVGFRSYFAYRALRQRGFTGLKTFSGGSTTFRAWHELDEADAPAQRSPMENYAEARSLFALAPTGIGASIALDFRGLTCPGPIMKLAQAATAADAGDAGATASARSSGSAAGGVTVLSPSKTSFVVFSGDMDKAVATFIIANGALAMGEQVSMFFTSWGLNALPREQPPKRQKKLMGCVVGMGWRRTANWLHHDDKPIADRPNLTTDGAA